MHLDQSQLNTEEHPEQEPSKPKKLTKWHEYLGTQFELLMDGLPITVLTSLPLMSQPPQADVVLLRRDYPTWTDEVRARLPDAIRDTEASDILIEFKFTESLNETAKEQAIIYDYLYKRHKLGQEAYDRPKERKKETLATFLLSSQSPTKKTLTRLGYAPTDQKGVYQSAEAGASRVTVLLLNELPLNRNNAFVKCFASHKKVREAAFALLRQEEPDTISDEFDYFLRALHSLFEEKRGENMLREPVLQVTKEEMIEYGRELVAGGIRHIPTRIIADAIPPEEFLEFIPTEKRLMGLRPEEIWQIPSMHQTLQEREQQSELRSQQRTLLRSLRRKFGDIPDNIVTLIEQTDDADQLDAWMDAIFDVDTLDEMAFEVA
ncbi:MAG: hypothetical protein AAF639_10035 [Chloroflexota bacterium]